MNAAVTERFKLACHEDERVVAAFLGGSHASGTADEYSDLDLYAVISDAEYDAFFAERRELVRRLGEPLFLEDFDGFGFDMLIFMIDGGVEGELALGRASDFAVIHGGPYEVLLDRHGVLAGKVFPLQRPSQEQQVEGLRRELWWLWRDLSLCLTAVARARLWSGYGYLESLRVTCANLLRLSSDFTGWPDGYDKLELVVPAEALEPLARSVVSIEPCSMLQAAGTLVELYQAVAPSLASAHELPYPRELESHLVEQLADLLESRCRGSTDP